jgi:hypothetical protein
MVRLSVVPSARVALTVTRGVRACPAASERAGDGLASRPAGRGRRPTGQSDGQHESVSRKFLGHTNVRAPARGKSSFYTSPLVSQCQVITRKRPAQDGARCYAGLPTTSGRGVRSRMISIACGK